MSKMNPFIEQKLTGNQQIVERNEYITYALTDGDGEIFGLIDDYYVNNWYCGYTKLFFWSEVLVIPPSDQTCGPIVHIIRRGSNLAGATNEELSALHRQSKINILGSCICKNN